MGKKTEVRVFVLPLLGGKITITDLRVDACSNFPPGSSDQLFTAVDDGTSSRFSSLDFY